MSQEVELFAQTLLDYCGGTLPIQYRSPSLSPLEIIIVELEKFYDYFCEHGFIDLSITSDFCNVILNQGDNVFISNEKSKMLEELEQRLDLSDIRKKIIDW